MGALSIYFSSAPVSFKTINYFSNYYVKKKKLKAFIEYYII